MGSGDFQTRVLVVDNEPVILETMNAIPNGHFPGNFERYVEGFSQ